MAKERQITCESCGRSMPRYKSAPIFKKVFGEFRKVYFCIGCAKHRGIGVHEAKRRVKQGFRGRRPPAKKP